MDTVTRNVNELASADRLALEHVLGHPLEYGQQIVIAVVPSAQRTELTREAARASLLKRLQQASDHAASIGISSEQADEAVEEAMAAVCPRAALP
jgi:hypothetical protein